MANPEQHTGSVEHGVEVAKAAAERSAELQRSHEKHETSPEQNEKLANEARAEAEKQARSAEEFKQTETNEQDHDNTPVQPLSSDAAYNATMATIQQDMSAPARTFSKIIHNKAVEKTSDVVGGTIARPNSLLAGSVFAFILVAALYVEARYIGYSLSGFETIGAFIAGWILGIVYDFLRTMITGKK